MAHYRENIEDIELMSRGIVRSNAGILLGEADIAANRFGVRVFLNHVPVSLTGVSCIGYFVRADRKTVVINGGTVSGNMAYVTLPQSCYAIEGRYTLCIKLSGGGVTGTMRIIDGAVVNTRTGTVIDPGSVVPDLTSLLAEINRMEAAVLNAEAAQAIITGTYDPPYAAGEYTIHGGSLYKANTSIASAETWTAAHWSQVTVGSELGSLHKAINDANDEITSVKDDLYEDYDIIQKSEISYVAGGSYAQRTLINADIPQGTEFSYKLSCPATVFNQAVLYAFYDGGSYNLTNNCQLNTLYTTTAQQHITRIDIYYSGSALATGTIKTEVIYSKHNSNTFEEKINNNTSNVELLRDNVDELYIDFVMQDGKNLIAQSDFHQGDINESGVITTGGSYYYSDKIDVDDESTYYISQTTEDDEGTKKVTFWTSPTYCAVHCYSDSSHLGIAAPSTGSDAGKITPIAGTTYVRIGHTLAARTADISFYKSSGYTQYIAFPSGKEDVTVKTFNTPVIDTIKIHDSQLDFRSVDGMCLLNKSDFSPWHIYGTRRIISSMAPIGPGYYYYHVQAGGLNAVYIHIFDSSRQFVTTITHGSYETPIKIKLPENTAYIIVDIDKVNVKLSQLETVNIFKFDSVTFGYDGTISRVINANSLPQLPPLALTGKAQGGIISLGHGGVSSIYAEDSIESFYALARQGFAGTEVDIQFTADHVPVCWHNSTLSTLEGATASDHISDYTLAELDANFDFRTWWDNRNCFRRTVARFEEVCVLARAYGWTLILDKMVDITSEEKTIIINMLKKYGVEKNVIVTSGYDWLREAFPDNPVTLTSLETVVNDTWVNGVLNRVIDRCHEDDDHNLIVNDDAEVYTCFNWKTIKESDGLEGCVAVTDLLVRHNVRPIWYTVETPLDIYQLVSQCPKTSIVLTGLYTIPDGMNEYLGLKGGNNRYDLSPTVHL